MTTFWSDFTIADVFGVNAIKDTYKRAFDEWKENVEYFTEFVIVLNEKCWQHFNLWEEEKKKSEDLQKNTDTYFEYFSLYKDLFYLADDYALETFKGEDLNYFIRTTD